MKDRLWAGSVLLSVSGLLAASLALLSSPSSLFGRDETPVPDHKLSEFSLGTHLSGEQVDLSKLEGRVVAIEKWGTK